MCVCGEKMVCVCVRAGEIMYTVVGRLCAYSEEIGDM